MDRDGVETSVIFGPILPMNLEDNELKNAVIETYNDWLVEFCGAAPKRLYGAAMLSKDDPIAARDEVLRLARGGKIVQVNHLTGDFHAGMYSDPAWDQFWSAAEEANMIVSVHVGGGTRSAPDARRSAPAPSGAFRSGGNAYADATTGMLSFGVLERHPNLKFVLAEARIGWLPYAVQSMDRSYVRGMESKGGVENGPLKQMPSETFKRQVYATYEMDQCGLYLLDFFGEGHVMWASDYPHPASTWPNSQAIVERGRLTCRRARSGPSCATTPRHFTASSGRAGIGRSRIPSTKPGRRKHELLEHVDNSAPASASSPGCDGGRRRLRARRCWRRAAAPAAAARSSGSGGIGPTSHRPGQPSWSRLCPTKRSKGGRSCSHGQPGDVDPAGTCTRLTRRNAWLDSRFVARSSFRHGFKQPSANRSRTQTWRSRGRSRPDGLRDQR